MMVRANPAKKSEFVFIFVGRADFQGEAARFGAEEFFFLFFFVFPHAPADTPDDLEGKKKQGLNLRSFISLV